MKLDRKVGIVTGAASGTGLAIAEAFAKEGANVTIADLNEEGGKKAVEGIERLDRDAIFVKTNISKCRVNPSTLRGRIKKLDIKRNKLVLVKYNF
jgi:NAD(P)-dependent dehydrogenase (short-subunit alcohol dehydrogenase family)